MKFLHILLFIFLINILPQANAGDIAELVYDNKVYADHIKSVEFFRAPYRASNENDNSISNLFGGSVNGVQRAFPVFRLGEQNALSLEFDDLQGELEDYTYSIIHCTRNWEKSDLFEDDYLDGYDEEELRNFEFSRTVDRSYVHYYLRFPNRDMNVRISGNFLFVVWDSYGDPLISRRFVVMEQIVPIIGQVRRPVKNQLARTHHEITFDVKMKDVNLDNPRLNITATVVQNFDWSTAIEDIEPFREGYQELIFDRRNVVLFPGMKPYRLLDLRNYLGGTIGTEEAYATAEGYYVILKPDNKRIFAEHLDDRDFNGSFFIGNVQDNRNNVTQSEYVNVMFRLRSNAPVFDRELYVLGAFNDYQPSEEYKMVYNEEADEYRAIVLLKEGVYDYYYVSRDIDDGTVYLEDTEGLMFEAFNDYHIFVYYRPFGARYDRVIGYAQVQ